MRNTRLPSLLAALIVVLAGLVAFAPVQAQTNLLENPGFEDGHYFQDGIVQLVIPNGWRLVWSNQEKIFGGQWDTTRPETVVWNITGAPAGEEFYWRDGSYTLKLWNTFAPLWTALTQDVEGLEVGRKYRLAVPIYVDVFEDFKDGRKVAPERKDTARVRLGAGPVGAAWRDENAIGYSGWWTAESIANFNQSYSTFVHDFVATQPNMTIYIEMASTYPYRNNGFFFDAPSLTALNETVAQPTAAPAAQQPTAAPVAGQPAAPAAPAAQPATVVAPTPRADGAVVHIVQEGDTMWVIAIRYASLLGLSAEEALPVLQERNGSPAFLAPGDEVIILPAGATTPTAGDGTPAADATTDPAATPEATVEGGATAEATTEGEVAPEGTTEVTPQAGTVAGTICVAAFDDANNDGQRNEGEALVANAAISISQANRTISTYITDGASEPYCFELNEADSYQLQLYPPTGYAPTTEDNWAVSIANNESYTVAFGISQTVAAAEADSAAQPTAPAEATGEAAVEADGGGLFGGNLGMIVLGAAGLLLVLAGVGVYLLRRG